MFVTQSAFKRNKHYYDALRVSQVEHKNAQKRRKPKQPHRYHDDKVDQTFLNANK